MATTLEPRGFKKFNNNRSPNSSILESLKSNNFLNRLMSAADSELKDIGIENKTN